MYAVSKRHEGSIPRCYHTLWAGSAMHSLLEVKGVQSRGRSRTLVSKQIHAVFFSAHFTHAASHSPALISAFAYCIKLAGRICSPGTIARIVGIGYCTVWHECWRSLSSLVGGGSSKPHSCLADGRLHCMLAHVDPPDRPYLLLFTRPRSRACVVDSSL